MSNEQGAKTTIERDMKMFASRQAFNICIEIELNFKKHIKYNM